jgi:hypothetical protein
LSPRRSSRAAASDCDIVVGKGGAKAPLAGTAEHRRVAVADRRRQIEQNAGISRPLPESVWTAFTPSALRKGHP